LQHVDCNRWLVAGIHVPETRHHPCPTRRNPWIPRSWSRSHCLSALPTPSRSAWTR